MQSTAHSQIMVYVLIVCLSTRSVDEAELLESLATSKRSLATELCMFALGIGVHPKYKLSIGSKTLKGWQLRKKEP